MGKAPRDVRYSRHEKTVVPANAQHDEQLTIGTLICSVHRVTRMRHTQQYTQHIHATQCVMCAKAMGTAQHNRNATSSSCTTLTTHRYQRHADIALAVVTDAVGLICLWARTDIRSVAVTDGVC
jgi:hypothetical protein